MGRNYLKAQMDLLKIWYTVAWTAYFPIGYLFVKGEIPIEFATQIIIGVAFNIFISSVGYLKTAEKLDKLEDMQNA